MAGAKDSGRDKGVSGSAMRVDTDLVRELAALLAENELSEIEVEDGDRKIKVRKDSGPAFVQAMPAQQAPAAAAAPAATASAQAKVEETAANAVKSPMVGTAFLSSEPGGKPFISEGQAVKTGDTLLIVEAMKVMNPIIAPSAGTVTKIMVSDGQPVEFDQPLVILA